MRTAGRAAAALLALLIAQASASPALADTERHVSGGVTIAGIELAGMTEQEVRDAVSGRVGEMGSTPVSLRIGDASFEVPLSELGLKWKNTGIVDEVMMLGTTGNIVQRYKDQKDLQNTNVSFDLTFTLDQGAVNDFTAGCEQYNTQPVNAEIYTSDDLRPAVRGGTDGITLDKAAAAEALTSLVESWDGVSPLSLDLPVTRVSPDIPASELEKISDVLGQATTDYGSSAYGRSVNVENGCRMISGTLLQPGDYFSVTDHVTPFTPENGYELAGAYEENQVVSAYGGGICQVSTTLYNAVLKAEMEVVSRSNHTMTVGYVDLSKDAAIAEGIMDLAFVNSLEDPVYIIGYCDGWSITFWIYGHETRPANRSLEFVSVTTSVTEPSGVKLVADPGQAVGYIDQTQSPHTGYTAELWKNIYYDGVLSDSVQVNSSYYDSVGTIYNIGVASSNAAQSQAMYAAIASNDINQVYAVINGAYAQPQSETQTQSETQAQTQAPVDDPYLTDPNAQVWTDPAAQTWTDTPAGETLVSDGSADAGAEGGW